MGEVMATEQEHIGRIEHYADQLNKAIEEAAKNTDLIIALNTTTLRREPRSGVIGKSAPPPIEQIEYTITREVARYDAK